MAKRAIAMKRGPSLMTKERAAARSRLHELSGTRDYTRHQKAKIAEAAVLLRVVVFGMTAYRSVFDGDKVDWFVETPQGRTWKVQVKWVRESRHGLPGVSLRCHEGNRDLRRYQEGEFDFIVGYDLYTDVSYVWSFEEAEHLRNSVTVCAEAAERWDKLLAKS